jgi:mRNA-degrading endonuclease RelE of RelBE toxin-antitoxin system
MEKLLKQLGKKAKNLIQEIEHHKQQIVQNALLGHDLKGDLKGFKSYDFKFQQVSIRVCYIYHEEDNHITFMYVGTRENFYKDVKRYLD